MARASSSLTLDVLDETKQVEPHFTYQDSSYIDDPNCLQTSPSNPGFESSSSFSRFLPSFKHSTGSSLGSFKLVKLTSIKAFAEGASGKIWKGTVQDYPPMTFGHE